MHVASCKTPTAGLSAAAAHVEGSEDELVTHNHVFHYAGTTSLVQQQSFPSTLSQLEEQEQQQLPFEVDRSAIENFLRPDPSELPDDVEVCFFQEV
jgi:hypothetical protein